MAKIFTRRIVGAALVLTVAYALTMDWSTYQGGLVIIGVQEALGAGIFLAIALRFLQLGWVRVRDRGD